ncbi:MAG: CotH kinase family protein [Spirochaetales bacterium]|nr:CotH kinase family protein [Spirochaetales bacterium]
MIRLLIKAFIPFSIIFFITGCAFFLNEDGFDPLERPTEDGLPVFYIHPAPKSTDYCPATVYYRGKKYKAEARVRGSVSRHFPMKSYALRFPEDQLFNDPEFQFHDERIIALTTSFSDNSFIRNRLAFDLWNHMDSAHVQIKTYNAVVYLNACYWGLYTICEHVDDLLLEENGLNRYGNLYKGVTHDANFYLKENLHEGFLKTEGNPEHGENGAYTDLDEFINFVCKTEPDDFVARLGSVLKQQEYEDWWMYVVFMMTFDCCNKNAYHYIDPAGGLWRYIPWDFNDAFGQLRTRRLNPFDDPDYTNLNNLFRRFLEQEEIFSSIKARYLDILSPGNAFDDNWIVSKIDEYDAEIHDAAVKSEKKWRKEYRDYGTWSDRDDFTTYEEEIQYMKNWVIDRHSFLLDKYD